MNTQDNLFFEEYKHLDKLCSEIYDSQSGVKEYLADMKSKSSQGQFHVPYWEWDYKQLKHVHWVRNQLAHKTAGRQLSEASDLSFVQVFYSRIISGEDPLTLLRKATEPRERPVPKNNLQKPDKKLTRAAAVLISLGIVLLILMLYLKMTGRY